jgi:hypothetical protein
LRKRKSVGNKNSYFAVRVQRFIREIPGIASNAWHLSKLANSTMEFKDGSKRDTADPAFHLSTTLPL